MKTDPAVKRTRDARRAISAAVAHDPAKLVEYYIEKQKRLGVRVLAGPTNAWEDDGMAEQQRGADAQEDARGSR